MYHSLAEKITILNAQLEAELDRLHAARVEENADLITRSRVKAQKLEQQLDALVTQAREVHRRYWLNVAAEVRPQFRQLIDPVAKYRRAMAVAGEHAPIESLIASLIADSDQVMANLGDGEIPQAAPDAPALDRAEDEIY